MKVVKLEETVQGTDIAVQTEDHLVREAAGYLLNTLQVKRVDPANGLLGMQLAFRIAAVRTTQLAVTEEGREQNKTAFRNMLTEALATIEGIDTGEEAHRKATADAIQDNFTYRATQMDPGPMRH